VLVVEDDPSVRNLVVRTLSNLGYSVLQAANGEEALKAAHEHANKVSLLLTDMIMPQMGGKELARRLVALNPHMRVLFASGYTEDAVTHHRILDKGMAFLPKPFTANDLARKVRQALQ
jgi:CheY-like chemotaxis protein